MKKRADTSQPYSKSDNPVQLVDAAPAVGTLPKVDGLTALAASLRFLDNNPGVEEQMNTVASARAAEILRDLEEDPETEMFLVSERNVRAIFAKAMHEAVGLVSLGMGSTATEATALQHQFDATETETTGILPGNTAAEPQNGI